jgi:hypothetical protein
MGLWLLVHFIGFTLWLGGGLASMVSGVTAKQFTPAERLKTYKVIGAVQRLLVGPGAAGVVLSGVMLMLSGPYMHSASGSEMPVWLNVMMGAGVLGAIVAVTVSMPTATRLARLEPDARGELPPSFAGLRKRQAIAATIAGVLGLTALFAATLGRY